MTAGPEGPVAELFREALACQQSGQHAKAEQLYRRILAVPAAGADAAYLPLAHYNLGSALQESGRLTEAEACYRQALRLSPGFAEAHFNLAVVALHQRRFDEAASAAGRTVSLRPEVAMAHHVLGMAQIELGQYKAAFGSFRRAARLEPPTAQFWDSWAACLAQYGVPDDAGDASLFADLGRLLERPEVEFRAVMRPMLQALIDHAGLGDVIRAVSQGEIGYTEIAERLSAITLLPRLMSGAAVDVPAVEKLLTSSRQRLLHAALHEGSELRGLPFSAALALQCFLNEYIFAETADEGSAVARLQEEIARRLASGADVPPIWIAALGSYRQLHGFPWAAKLLQRSWPAEIAAVLVAQVAEPQEEAVLRGAIPRLTTIADTVSQAVRAQYEDHPYPRWTKPVWCEEPRTVAQILRDVSPHIAVDEQRFGGDLDILVAGCGTGMNALHVASRFARARVLAIDLSLSSLAYAWRRTRQLGAANIDYGQADILELRQLGRQFDLIDCMGVLHHLGDPVAGWRALVANLRLGGLMRVGLYSELGRQGVVKARAMIAAQGYAPTAENIRGFRQEILAMDPTVEPEVAGLVHGDLHTMSECRDLLFHVQEHRYFLPQIDAMLKELGLTFLGFELSNPESLRSFQRHYSGSEALASLPLWHRYEQENPRTFGAMYQFWCRKD